MNFTQLFITILWVGYGILTTYQLNNNSFITNKKEIFYLCLIIFLAPMVLFTRAFRGAFLNKGKL